MGSKYRLENWEIAMIKAMWLRGNRSYQNILSYFTRPDRDLNHRVIPEVLFEHNFRKIAPADDDMLDHFTRFRERGDTLYFPRIRRAAIDAAGGAVFDFGYRMFPVGQGLFSSGWISRQHDAPFRWVYDCGTSNRKRRRLVLRGLAHLRADTRASGRRDHLDLFTVSHFDEDHVSGLRDLLRHFSVGTLVLPYLAPWDRLLVALSEDAAAESDLLAFLLAPTAFVLGLPGVEIERIVLVPPSDGPSSTPVEPTRRDGPMDYEIGTRELKIDRGEVPGEGDEAGGPDGGLADPRVEVLAPGGTLTLPYLWEFVPYNDPACAGLATLAFRDTAEPFATTLRTSNDVSLRDEALAALKALYADAFGSSAKQKNIISLFLYSGPVGRSFLLRGYETAFRHRFLSWRIGQIDPRAGERFALMMTGDGYLETAARWNSFASFYGPHGRLRRSGCFQVMHHGSKSNWRAGSAHILSPAVSLFSSHPTGEYHHPHPDVLRDFASYNPRQIDRVTGWSFEGTFAFE